MNSTVDRIGKDEHERLLVALSSLCLRSVISSTVWGRSLVVHRRPDHARLPVQTMHCEPGGFLVPNFS